MKAIKSADKLGIGEEVELDEAPKLPPHLAKFFDKDGNLKKDAADRIAKGRQKLNIKDVTPKGYGPKEEVELDEEVSVKDFDALKKGDTVTIEYKSGMSSGTGTYTVTAKNKVAKGKVEKVTLKSTKNPGGVKYFLYKRDNKVGFAQGDMGASVVSFKKEEVEEGAAADARRAMRSDPEMKQRAFSKDVSATDDDEKAASKNIMMQLRKAQRVKLCPRRK